MKIPMRRIHNALFPAGEEAARTFEATEVGTLYQVEIKPTGQQFSEPQLGIFWYWMSILAKDIGGKYTKDDMHDIVCHKFLGYEEKVISKTTIKGLRTLTWPKRLKKDELSELLSKTDAWAIELGIYLPTKQDSEYQTYKEANQ